MIPYGRQDITEADVQAVLEVLRSDFLTQGPAVPAFEEAVAAYCGARFGVAVSNGTTALHLACLALGVGPGDRVWTSPNTFVASANCARYCGAEVDFVDIDPRTYNMSTAALAEKLAIAEKRGQLPKVVIPVHFAGQPCEMAAIAALAARYGFRVIEDACHALGADYRGGKVGNGEYADMTVFSFHPVKIITTGEGGLITTNDPVLAESLRLLRTHGITREIEAPEDDQGGWYYEQRALGFNYRLTDIQAALGRSQMARLEPFITRRRALAAQYDELLAGLPVVRPWQHSDGRSAWHLYMIQLELDRIGLTRRQAFDRMRAAGIGVHVHYIPVHTQPYYRALGFDWGDFPVAEAYYRRALTLPIYAGLTDEDQARVAATLREVLS